MVIKDYAEDLFLDLDDEEIEMLRRQKEIDDARIAAEEEAKRQTPEMIKNRVIRLERENACLWELFYKIGYHNEAEAYVEEHGNEELPFEW